MIAIIYFLIGGLIMNGEKQIFDFSSQETSGDWRIINDVVMGGISNSKFEINDDSTATFSGTVLPDNNGGFASTRTMLDNEYEDYQGVIIRVKGDGKIYNLRFRTDKNYDGISYQSKFRTEANTWKEFKIPFSKFLPTYRGRTMTNEPELYSKDIKQVGILIADKQFGEFKLDVQFIKFF